MILATLLLKIRVRKQTDRTVELSKKYMITLIVLGITGIGAGFQIVREFQMRMNTSEKKIYYPEKKSLPPRKRNGQFKRIERETYTSYRRSIGLPNL